MLAQRIHTNRNKKWRSLPVLENFVRTARHFGESGNGRLLVPISMGARQVSEESSPNNDGAYEWAIWWKNEERMKKKISADWPEETDWSDLTQQATNFSVYHDIIFRCSPTVLLCRHMEFAARFPRLAIGRIQWVTDVGNTDNIDMHELGEFLNRKIKNFWVFFVCNTLHCISSLSFVLFVQSLGFGYACFHLKRSTRWLKTWLPF
jgi:hypothetical protein